MSRIRSIATATSLAAALALAIPAAAGAQADHLHHLVPEGAKVVGGPVKQLSAQKAARAARRAAKTGEYPRFPRVVGVDSRRLERVAPEPSTAAPPALVQDVTRGGGNRMFNSTAGYYAQRGRILGAIGQFFASSVPKHGVQYRAPALYEVQNGGTIPGCGWAVYNAAYCGAINSIGWSMDWTTSAFAQSGDMKWATLIAHEYGHAAQQQLGIRGGAFVHRLSGESFADCMAGAFFQWAAYYGYTDNLGRGDGFEFRDMFQSLASSTTANDTWGTFDVRYRSALYGWTYGFNGCVAWGRSVDGV